MGVKSFFKWKMLSVLWFSFAQCPYLLKDFRKQANNAGLGGLTLKSLRRRCRSLEERA